MALSRVMQSWLVDNRGRPSSVGAEVRGGIVTFLTMAYILPVNAGILSAVVGAEKMGALVAATALAAAVCCLLMGFVANAPIALAAGMGLNATIAFGVASQAGSWQAAMGLVVIEGLIILLLVLAGLREAVMNAIPRELRLAIGAGIGLFIALIGFANCGLALPGMKGGPLLQHGSLRVAETWVAMSGLVLTATLMAWRIRGALLIGIVATTLVALAAGVAKWPGIGNLVATPVLSSVVFQADLKAALQWKLVPVIFAIMMVDFFDTLGTATAVSESAGLVDEKGRIPKVRRILVVDSLAASIGGLLGVSSNTSYIESGAGVAEGARTGLHTVVVGCLFLLSMAAWPLVSIVPAAATAPALILVGFLMLKQIKEIDLEQLDLAIPAFLILLGIPATFSIAHGIGLGILSFVAIRVLTGRAGMVSPLMYVVAVAFGAYFVWG